ncbi:MAG: DUF4403 family protein [Cytophagales bacterium]
MKEYNNLWTWFSLKFNFDFLFVKKYLVYSTFFFITLFSVWSCKKRTPQPKQDLVFESKEDSLVPPLSFFSFKIGIDAKTLQQKLDKELSGLIQEGRSDDEDLYYRVSKNGNLSLDFENDELKYRLPLKVFVKYTLDFLGAKKDISSEMEISLRFGSKIELDSNFNFRTYTKADGFQFLSDPVVMFGGIKIPIKGALEVLVKKNQPKLAVLIDDYVQKEINTQAIVKQIWNEIQQEFNISSENNLFFRAIPMNLKISDIKLRNQQLIASIGIPTYLLTRTGSFGKIIVKPLPKLEKTNSISSSSELNLVSFLYYDELTKLANSMLKGQIFEFQNGKRKVKIEDINIGGKSGKLMADVELSGNVAERIVLFGEPFFDNSKKEISIKNLEYKLETQKRLVKKANWLLKSKFEKKLEKQMVFSVKKELDDMEQNIKNELKNLGSQHGLLPVFAIRKIEVAKLNIKKSNVELMLQILSEFELNVQRID